MYLEVETGLIITIGPFQTGLLFLPQYRYRSIHDTEVSQEKRLFEQWFKQSFKIMSALLYGISAQQEH